MSASNNAPSRESLVFQWILSERFVPCIGCQGTRRHGWERTLRLTDKAIHPADHRRTTSGPSEAPDIHQQIAHSNGQAKNIDHTDANKLRPTVETHSRGNSNGDTQD